MSILAHKPALTREQRHAVYGCPDWCASRHERPGEPHTTVPLPVQTTQGFSGGVSVQSLGGTPSVIVDNVRMMTPKQARRLAFALLLSIDIAEGREPRDVYRLGLRATDEPGQSVQPPARRRASRPLGGVR